MGSALTSWQQDGAGLTTWCLELSQAGATQGSLDVISLSKVLHGNKHKVAQLSVLLVTAFP